MFVKNGGKLLVQHRVTGIKPGAIVTVETDKGVSFQAKKLIVTAGPWTKNLVQAATGIILPLKVILDIALFT